MKRIFIKTSILSIIFMLLLISVYFKSTLAPQLKINEVSFQNNSGKDWIEIYNPSLNAKNLKGMYLTDDKTKKTRFQILDNILINSKGFLLIGAKETDEKEVLIKTNFGLKNGETLFLIDKNGREIVDSFPLVLADENSVKTVGRFPDGSEDIFIFSSPTPGTFNNKDEQ